MFLTITPFIAEGVASDWPKAVACLERTLGSIFGNPARDLRAVVICQDRPPLKIKDDRYIFLKTNLPKPDKQNYWAKSRDKSDKIYELFQAARELSPEYVMLVDADDLISNGLTTYVYQHPNYEAFCLKTGFEWVENTPRFTLRSRFNQYCGSSFVWRFNEKLFPAFLGNSKTKYICELGHNEVEAAMDAEGFLVDKIYEPKAVYVTGHANHMMAHRTAFKKRIKDMVLSPWRNYQLTPELEMEFGLTHEKAKGNGQQNAA